MIQILTIIEVIVAVCLALSILLQSRGAGLGSLAGGGGEAFVAERRGAEKFLFQMTILLGAVFMMNAFLIGLLS